MGRKIFTLSRERSGLAAQLVHVEQELAMLDPTDCDDGDRRQQEIMGEGRRGVGLPRKGAKVNLVPSLS